MTARFYITKDGAKTSMNFRTAKQAEARQRLLRASHPQYDWQVEAHFSDDDDPFEGLTDPYPAA